MNGISALDLNLLVALHHLLDAASVTAAAREVGLSQPAMSRALSRLRAVLGDPLLVRDGRAWVLTDRARALTPAVRRAMIEVERVFAAPQPFDPSGARGAVRLAFGDDAQAAFGGAIVAAFAARAPGLDVRFHPLVFDTVRDGRAGRIDLALTPDLAALPPSAGRVDLDDFVVQRVYDRSFAVAWSPSRVGPPPVTLEAFTAAEHLVVAFDGSGRGFVDDLLERRGVTRRVACTVTGFDAAAAVLGETSLVATLPVEVVARSALASGPPPVEIPSLPMCLAWHPRSTADPRHRFVREVVQRAVRTVLDRGCYTEGPPPAPIPG
ncbi:MAG: LysR family transcriptional regulator [Myxococcota bacterium]